jgi:hypothetical protein
MNPKNDHPVIIFKTNDANFNLYLLKKLKKKQIRKAAAALSLTLSLFSL